MVMRQNALSDHLGAPAEVVAKAQALDKQAYLQAIETLQQHLNASAQLRHALLGEKDNSSSGSGD